MTLIEIHDKIQTMDFDKEFANLTQRLQDVVPEIDGLSLAHLSDFADILGTLIAHVNRYITRTLADELEAPPEITSEMIVGITHAYDLLLTLSELFCQLTCGSDLDDDDDEDIDGE